MQPSLARWVRNPKLEAKVRAAERLLSDEKPTSVREELQDIARQHAVDLAYKTLMNAMWGADI